MNLTGDAPDFPSLSKYKQPYFAVDLKVILPKECLFYRELAVLDQTSARCIYMQQIVQDLVLQALPPVSLRRQGEILDVLPKGLELTQASSLCTIC